MLFTLKSSTSDFRTILPKSFNFSSIINSFGGSSNSLEYKEKFSDDSSVGAILRYLQSASLSALGIAHAVISPFSSV